MLTSANTSRTRRSGLEAAIGESIGYFADQGLIGGILAPQGEEADLVLIQIDFTTNQGVGPDLPQWPDRAQQDHRAVAVASPQVDQPATRPLLQVELPLCREG